jgi:hypothetical protein
MVKTVSSYLDCLTLQTSFLSATYTSSVMRAGVAQGGLVSPVLFSLCVNDIPTPSRHVDDTAFVATSLSPSLLVGYLELYHGTLELCLRDWRIAINVSKDTAMLFVTAARWIRKPKAMQFLGEPIDRYVGVTLDTRLMWSSHVNQVRRKAARRLGVLGLLLNRRSGLSVTNCVLLYEQLIRPMTDYACPVCRTAVHSHVRQLQVLQSKCLRLVTNAPWYVGKWHIHEDMGIPLFAGHFRALTEFRLEVSRCGEPLNPATWKVLGRCRPKADWNPPQVTEVNWCLAGQPRLSLKRQPIRSNE